MPNITTSFSDVKSPNITASPNSDIALQNITTPRVQVTAMWSECDKCRDYFLITIFRDVCDISLPKKVIFHPTLFKFSIDAIVFDLERNQKCTHDFLSNQREFDELCLSDLFIIIRSYGRFSN